MEALLKAGSVKKQLTFSNEKIKSPYDLITNSGNEKLIGMVDYYLEKEKDEQESISPFKQLASLVFSNNKSPQPSPKEKNYRIAF